MKNFRLIIALLLWSIVIISSCKKDKSTDSPINANSYELAPNTVIIDSPTSHIIQSVDSIKIIFDPCIFPIMNNGMAILLPVETITFGLILFQILLQAKNILK